MRILVVTFALTSWISSGESAGMVAWNCATGGSPALAAVVWSWIFTPRSPSSASEWFTARNLTSSCPGFDSDKRKPASSMYLASGCLLEVVAGPVISTAGCFPAGVGAGLEQPASKRMIAANVSRTNSRIIRLMFRTVREQIDTVFRRDPAARSVIEIVLCYPGFHAVLLHRMAHGLYRRGWYTLARIVSQYSRAIT